jgi:hypothetical protein
MARDRALLAKDLESPETNRTHEGDWTTGPSGNAAGRAAHVQGWSAMNL